MVSPTLLVELGGVIFALGVLGTIAGRIGLSRSPCTSSAASRWATAG